MKEAQFVNPDQIETLEQYGAALISSVISLNTLEQFHIAAFKKGLLEQDEEECSKTICWEIRRLVALYSQQLNHIMERTELDEDKILNNLKSLMPDIHKPKKRKSKKKEDEIHNLSTSIN